MAFDVDTFRIPATGAMILAGGMIAIALFGLIRAFSAKNGSGGQGEFGRREYGKGEYERGLGEYGGSRNDPLGNRQQAQAAQQLEQQLESQALQKEENHLEQEALGDYVAARNELAHLQKLEEKLKVVVEAMKEALRKGFPEIDAKKKFIIAFKNFYKTLREAEQYFQTVEVDTSLVARDLQALRNKVEGLAKGTFFLKRHLQQLAAMEQVIMQNNKTVKESILAMREESRKEEYLKTLQLIEGLAEFPYPLGKKMEHMVEGRRQMLDASLQQYLQVLVVLVDARIGHAHTGLLPKALQAQENSTQTLRRFVRLFRKVEGELAKKEQEKGKAAA